MRYLLVIFAVMFLANNAVASARACMVQLAADEHTAIRILDSSGNENLCPEADSAAANCLAHCTQSYKSDQQNLSFDTPAVAVAPPLSLHRAWIPIEPRTCRSSFATQKIIEVTGERPVSKMVNSHFRP